MATSPKFNGELDHFFDPNFTEEISHKMQVPKRIKVNGENEDDIVIGVGGSQPISAWHADKIDMHVPDRILVIDTRPEITELEFDVMSRNNDVQFWNDGIHMNKPNSTANVVNGTSQKQRNARMVRRKSSSLQIPYLRSIRSETFLSGQDEFSGTRGPPLEASHENAVLRPEVERVRVQTPPSTITMHEYNFPSADDLAPPELGETPPTQGFVRPKGQRRTFDDSFTSGEAGDHRVRQHEFGNGYSRGGMDSRNDSFITNDRYRMQQVSQYREGTPPLTDGMSANEEIAHLRRQLAKLNRRVMSIELENLQRQQYEKIACALSVGYIIWKTLLWLRSSS